MRKGHAVVLIFVIFVALIAVGVMWYSMGPHVGIPTAGPGEAFKKLIDWRCIDSDGGRVPDVKGTAKGLSVFPDEGVAKKTDYCIQKKNGKFILDNNARDPYLAGKVDKCGNDCAIMEYSCAKIIVADVVDCPAGCKNGACVSAGILELPMPPTPRLTCTDSDGGIVYPVQGVVTITKFGTTTVVKDGCTSTNEIVEYSCAPDNSLVTTTGGCQFGCKDGACVAAATPTCTDSDGGKTYAVKGSVSYTNNPYGVGQEFDICDVGNTLIERVCRSQTEYTQNFERYTCPNGCKDGACVSAGILELPMPPAPQPACKCGLNNFNVGTLCDGNIELGTRGAQYGCQDGTAFAADPTTSPCKLPSEWQADADKFCTGHCGGNCCKDTDGGQNYFVKGTTTGITRCVDQSQCMAQPSTTDICGGTPSGSPNSLQEYVCDLGIFRSVIFYDCPNGCKDGACLP